MIDVIETLHGWTTNVLLWVGTPVQLAFVGLYFTRKWHKYKFSRALMWKSGSLALYLYASWSKVMVAGTRNYDWPLWIDVQTTLINVLVFWAIVNQLWALVADIRVGSDVETEVKTKQELPD